MTQYGRNRLLAGVLCLGGVLALAVVWVVEHELGIMPCELCLWERWPWRVLIGLGLLGLLSPWQWGRFWLWLCVVPLLASIGLTLCHAGVEWGWWPSPLPSCHAPHVFGHSMAERLASMPKLPSKPCDAPTYLVPGLPVSMTVMGGLYALALLVVVLVGGVGGRRSSRRFMR